MRAHVKRAPAFIMAAVVTRVLLVFTCMAACAGKAHATRLPPDLKENILNVFPDGKVRLDGSIATSRGELFLPVVPALAQAKKRGKAVIESAFPSAENPDLVIYGNGWCFLRVMTKGVAKTVLVPTELPDKVKRHLLGCKFPSDLIVPDNFVIAASLKPLAGELAMQTVKDATLANPDFGQPPKQTGQGHKGDGHIFLTSLSTGAITMLDDRNMSKVTDFPTEGTPSSMAWANGFLYITDQAKNRILILDPARKQFLGQIDLPLRSAPKGIAALKNGALLYVSESGANDIVVIEVATKRVLMRTKVAPGPGRLALTPNGNFLIALNVPCGQVTIISTLNQKVMATLPTGAMPSTVAISSDSQVAYVSNRQANTVSVIDLGKRLITSTIQTGQGPTGLALNPDDTQLFVANARDNSISIYDTKTFEKVNDVKLPLDIDFPSSLSLMPDGKRLLVSSEATDTVGVLNLTSLQFESQSIIGHSSHDIIWIPKLQ